MTKTRLTDLQSVLLSTACARESESLIPAPVSLAGKEAEARKALVQLLKRGLVVETGQPPLGTEWRTDGDLRFGLVLSDLGRPAIGVTAQLGGREDPVLVPEQFSVGAAGSAAPSTSVTATTKSATVVALMCRDQGATLAELVEATGWLPHTTRAALTGLRKKGHDLVKGKRGEATCYNVLQATA